MESFERFNWQSLLSDCTDAYETWGIDVTELQSASMGRREIVQCRIFHRDGTCDSGKIPVNQKAS